MINLENDKLKIGINTFGAELRSVVNKESGQEYMWSGEAYYWNRVSPVLFPTVGKVFNGEYHYNGETFHLPQHGFLRDQQFELVESTDVNVVFSFKSNEESLKVYPFKHEVRIAYVLDDATLSIHWYVINLDEKTLYYSIGAHPAFAMKDGEHYEFELETDDEVSLVTLEKGHVSGFVKQDHVDTIAITTEAFKNDALVYTGVDAVTLVNKDTNTKIRCSFPGFDYVGLWTGFKDERLAPFVCIEPWLGITDEVGGYEDISKKLSIKTLEENHEDHHVYRLEFL